MTLSTKATWPAAAALCLLSAGCATQGEEVPGAVGIANPASTHCIGLGGRLVIQKDPVGNEVGMCHLPDGTVVEEWALFRRDNPRRGG